MKTAVFLTILSLSILVTEGKWCVGWQRKAGEKPTSLLPCNFESFDTDKDGRVGRMEFLEVATGYGQEGTGVVFAILDTNDDDFIEPEEFLEKADRLVQLHVMTSCEITKN